MEQSLIFKKIIPGLVVGILLFLLATDDVTINKKESDFRPNILLINIDDLGWKDLSYMGSSYYETPNIDQLADQGMVFSHAYASAANCAPSRAALFTGQYSPRTGVHTVANSDRGATEHRKLIPIENTPHIDENTLTIADLLQKSGYKTAHVGKWHISEDPTKNGFDLNVGGFEAGNPAWGDMGGYFAPYNNPYLKEGPSGEYLTDRLTREAVYFLQKVEGQPFFLNYSPYIVHTPIEPKESLYKKYEVKQAGLQHDNAGYAAMVETMDRNIGKLLTYLKKSGEYNDTFIIFTSDNGGLYPISKQWPLRAGKGSYFEGGIRVPMIVVWPGVVKPGSTSSQPVSNVDFFPTLQELAGIEKPKGKTLDGISLLPALKGKQLESRPLFWHFPIYLQAYDQKGEDPETHDPYFRTRPGSVIQIWPWKLHEYFEDGRLELYNLETDIGEKRNLVDVFPEKASELHKRLVQWRKEINASVPTRTNPGYEGE